jgi:hypothetical protein
MPAPNTPGIDCEQHHPSLYVADVLAAADFYTKKLGFNLGFTCNRSSAADAGRQRVWLDGLRTNVVQDSGCIR